MSKLAVIYGTKSEEIRLLPVINILTKNKIPVLPVQTGQEELQMKENFVYSNQVLARNITDRQGLIMQRLNSVLDDKELEAILVVGNTLSAFCGALYGFLRDVSVIHLNAGQRTYNLHNAFPEEGFGQLISKLAEIHLTTTKFTYKNLVREGISKKEIFIVGNTLVDAMKNIKVSKRSKTKDILVAIHRKENIKKLKCICMVINNLTKEYQDHIFNIILPRDLDVSRKANAYLISNNNVNILTNLSHEETLNLINKSELIITDGFGIQEEATILKKPTIIIRKCIENVESLKTRAAILAEAEYNSLLNTIEKVLKGKLKFKIKDCKYYKENAAENIYKVIDKFYNKT